jgi:hypothetical protein
MHACIHTYTHTFAVQQNIMIRIILFHYTTSSLLFVLSKQNNIDSLLWQLSVFQIPISSTSVPSQNSHASWHIQLDTMNIRIMSIQLIVDSRRMMEYERRVNNTENTCNLPVCEWVVSSDCTWKTPDFSIWKTEHTRTSVFPSTHR